MPYVGLQTSVRLDDAGKDLLQETIAKLITVIPGKRPDHTMINLIDGVSLHMGLGKADCLYIEVKMLGEAPFEAKSEFVVKACEILSKQLSVEPANIYINFTEHKNWGSNGNFR